MRVAPAYADRFCLVGKHAAEREAVIQMQEDSQFFCLAQCQKVIDVERVSSQMVLPGSCQHPRSAAAALPSRLSVSERCQGQVHFAASNGWVVGDTILLDGTWFPKAVFSLSGDF